MKVVVHAPSAMESIAVDGGEIKVTPRFFRNIPAATVGYVTVVGEKGVERKYMLVVKSQSGGLEAVEVRDGAEAAETAFDKLTPGEFKKKQAAVKDKNKGGKSKAPPLANKEPGVVAPPN